MAFLDELKMEMHSRLSEMFVIQLTERIIDMLVVDH